MVVLCCLFVFVRCGLFVVCWLLVVGIEIVFCCVLIVVCSLCCLMFVD